MRLTAEERRVVLKIGSYGGKKAARNMTAEQRKERSRKAINTRWARVREMASQAAAQKEDQSVEQSSVITQ